MAVGQVVRLYNNEFCLIILCYFFPGIKNEDEQIVELVLVGNKNKTCEIHTSIEKTPMSVIDEDFWAIEKRIVFLRQLKKADQSERKTPNKCRLASRITRY